MSSLELLLSILFLTFSIENVESLRCWTCSSNRNPYCAEPLTRRSQTQHGLRLQNCDGKSVPVFPYVTDSRPVCIKDTRNIEGKMVTIRRCEWQRKGYSDSPCPITKITLRHKYNSLTDKFSCQSCVTDGCNSD